MSGQMYALGGCRTKDPDPETEQQSVLRNREPHHNSQKRRPCHWGTRARSLIGYGQVEIVTDREQKKHGLDIIMRQHGKTGPNLYDEKRLDAILILKVVIESVTCKQVGNWSPCRV